MQLTTGQKIPLQQLLGSEEQLSIRLKFEASFDMDYSCFGLNEQAKLQHDDYMTFFNQPQSPKAEVLYQRTSQGESFTFDLARIGSQSPQRYVICATIDHPSAVMSHIQNGHIEILKQNNVVASYQLSGKNFAAEKAVMLIEVYQKGGVWRLGTIGQGFNGGLKALVEHFGGDVAEEVVQPTAASTPLTSTIDLRKKIVLDKISSQAPQLIDLTKKSLISLEKKNLLALKARVGLVLDRSGSMHNQYKQGDVQKVIDRVLPLAVNFDDDGAFECWAFGKKTVRLDDVSLSNVSQYIETTHRGWRNWDIGPAINYEPEAIEKVINHYKQFNDGIPTYIVFISDGGVHENKKITRLISDAAKLPIFWQFIGIGGSSYGILEKLDDMSGRIVDNCNFFSLDNITQLPDETLYDLLLEEFPDWLKAAKQKGILHSI